MHSSVDFLVSCLHTQYPLSVNLNGIEHIGGFSRLFCSSLFRSGKNYFIFHVVASFKLE